MDDKRALRHAIAMLQDTLRTAASQAYRASEMFDRQEEAVLFHNLGSRLSELRELAPEIVSLRTILHSTGDRT